MKSHYIDVDLRQERGKLCFVKRKDNVFLSDNRVMLEEKVWIFRVLPFWIKKVVNFLLLLSGKSLDAANLSF